MIHGILFVAPASPRQGQELLKGGSAHPEWSKVAMEVPVNNMFKQGRSLAQLHLHEYRRVYGASMERTAPVLVNFALSNKLLLLYGGGFQMGATPHPSLERPASSPLRHLPQSHHSWPHNGAGGETDR